MASPDHDVSRRRGDVGPHRHLEDQTDHLLFFCHLSSPVARHYSHASLSLRSPCGTCWFAPKICSSLPWCGCLDMLAPLECVAGELQRPRRRSAQWACADGWHVRARGELTYQRFSCSGVMAARQLEIRLSAKAKACDVCANAAFRISTPHRRCLHDVM